MVVVGLEMRINFLCLSSNNSFFLKSYGGLKLSKLLFSTILTHLNNFMPGRLGISKSEDHQLIRQLLCNRRTLTLISLVQIIFLCDYDDMKLWYIFVKWRWEKNYSYDISKITNPCWQLNYYVFGLSQWVSKRWRIIGTSTWSNGRVHI